MPWFLRNWMAKVCRNRCAGAVPDPLNHVIEIIAADLAAGRLDRKQLVVLVDQWAGRLGVDMVRVQIQPMGAKWGSISTAGNLTLARDVLQLPRPLVDYIICHELLHLQVPHHNRLYRLVLSRYIPDWRELERELGRWTLAMRET